MMLQGLMVVKDCQVQKDLAGHTQRDFTPVFKAHKLPFLAASAIPELYHHPLAACGVSLCIGTTGSHVPYQSLVKLRATYMPDAARADFRTAPKLIPEEGSPPGFDII